MSRVYSSAYCFMLLCLLATAALAAESAPGIRLAVVGEAVDVFDRDCRLLQSLPFDGELPDEDNKEFFAIAEDMDFDGFPDVRILFSRGMVNTYYDCWLWSPKEKAFVKREDMRELSNPVFNPAERIIHTYERGSAVCHVEGELFWNKGALIWLGKTVMDEADDGEGIVVRRYRRGLDGELQLVDEMRRLPEEMDGCSMADAERADSRTVLSGLNFVIDVPADLLAAAILPNGEWWLRQGLPDRTVLIESRRLPPQEYEEEAVNRLIRVEWPQAREVAVASFSALAEKTSYPAFKAEFLSGENEDTRQFVAAILFADEWSFWFVLEAAADAQLGDDAEADASMANTRLKKDMEKLLLGMEAVEGDEEDFMAGIVASPIYLAGEDSSLRISVMDAIIRIKKIVDPEESPWIGTAPVAYRYDGPGMIDGRRVLLFSFGADSREKFTAERHFAVDEAGMVYEMDVPAGGEYWKWEENGVSWWGEYRRGDVVLSIRNYREGPEGMYFNFVFSNKEDVVFEGTASARGRIARYGPLVFSLDEGDETVTVAAEAEIEEKCDDVILLEGAYKME